MSDLREKYFLGVSIPLTVMFVAWLALQAKRFYAGRQTQINRIAAKVQVIAADVLSLGMVISLFWPRRQISPTEAFFILMGAMTIRALEAFQIVFLALMDLSVYLTFTNKNTKGFVEKWPKDAAKIIFLGLYWLVTSMMYFTFGMINVIARIQIAASQGHVG